MLITQRLDHTKLRDSTVFTFCPHIVVEKQFHAWNLLTGPCGCPGFRQCVWQCAQNTRGESTTSRILCSCINAQNNVMPFPLTLKWSLPLPAAAPTIKQTIKCLNCSTMITKLMHKWFQHLYCIVLYCIVLYWWGGHCCPMHCDLFKIYCAPRI